VEPRQFTTTLADNGRGGAFLAVPFDPDQVWAVKRRHHVTGTVNGCRVRGVIETGDGPAGFTVGATWLRGFRGVAIGDTVTVVIAPEGPQREDLDDDVAAALDGNPEEVGRRRDAPTGGAGRTHRRAGETPDVGREATPETRSGVTCGNTSSHHMRRCSAGIPGER
jgi:hypothetical protein